MSPETRDDDLCVGIASLDAQHEALQELFDDLGGRLTSAAPDEDVRRAFVRLEEYGLAHFRYEEELLERTACPGAAEHRFSHQHLRLQFLTLVEDALAAKRSPAVMAVNLGLMARAMHRHILSEDKNLAAHLTAAADRRGEDRMAPVMWSSELELGVPQIDAEHRRMVDLLGDYHARLVARAPEQEVRALARTAVAYVEMHFRHEEELFERSAYPRAAEHRFKHRHMMLHLTSLVDDSMDTQKPLSILTEHLELMRLLLLEHFKGEDRMFAAYAKAAAG